MKNIKPLDSSILVFVHVKKTAGISIQLCLLKQYGNKFYGGYSHSEIRRAGAVDHKISIDTIEKLPLGSCICKHWPMSDFQSIAHKSNFVAVVRHPVSRLICHYNFYKKHHPSGDSIDEYIRQPESMNVYKRMISNPDELCEIYIFEDLDNCLRKSKIIKLHKLPYTNKTRYHCEFSDSQINDVKMLNKEDLDFYKWAQGNNI